MISVSVYKCLCLVSYAIALQPDYHCSKEKLFDVPLTFNLVNEHFYSKYTIRKINETCQKGQFCFSHLTNRGLHETMKEMSKVWIDPRLRDEICSDLIRNCIKDLEKNSSYIIQDFLTPIAHTLMCHVALESDSDECILSSLELVQYSFWHIESEINTLFGLSSQCDNVKINSSACENLGERLLCLKSYCSEAGFNYYLKTIYPNLVLGNTSDISKNCAYLRTKFIGDKIIFNFINKVSVKSAVIGLSILLVLCIIAVLIAFYLSGRFPTAHLYNARQYIRLRNKDHAETIKTADENDDLKVETTQLLPDNKT